MKRIKNIDVGLVVLEGLQQRKEDGTCKHRQVDDLPVVSTNFYCFDTLWQKATTYCCCVAAVICLSTHTAPFPSPSPSPCALCGGLAGICAGSAPSTGGRPDVPDGSASDG